MNSRAFIRHPVDIPIDYSLTDEPIACHHDSMANLSIGGLCFHSRQPIEQNQWLHIHIPVNNQHFELDAQVKWCRSDENHYEVGVQFYNASEAFSARMVEQVCYIELYKQHILNTEGRQLSGDQAAKEWIDKYADSFPDTVDIEVEEETSSGL